MPTNKKRNKNKIEAILSEPPALTSEMRDRLIRLASLTQNQLAEQIRSMDPQVSSEALFILSCLNLKGSPGTLLQIVLDGKLRPYTRSSAAGYLRTLSSAKLRRQMVQLLNQQNSEIDDFGKVFLIRSLDDPLSNRAITFILSMFENIDEHPIVRSQCVEIMLDSFGDKQFVNAEGIILQHLADPSPMVRFACCRALSRSKDDRRVLPALMNLTEDQSISTNSIDRALCGEVGTCAKSAIREIRRHAQERLG